MKLYVWCDPYRVHYGTSMFFAVAESVEAAKEIARSAKAKSYTYSEIEEVRLPEAELGEPSRIVELPCGEWHKWEE